MTLTVRSASVTGATTAARALTHAEMDANWAHVISSANQSFVQSGSGSQIPVARSVQSKERDAISSDDFSSGYGVLNIGVGVNALRAITTGTRNSALGESALKVTTTGSNNSALGGTALKININGSSNAAVGVDALVANTSGSYNVAIGASALATNNTADNNTAVGTDALQYNTTGTRGVAVGIDALQFAGTGNYNVAIGPAAMQCDLVALGGSLTYVTGASNVAIGNQTMIQTSSGHHNVGVGENALYDHTTGSYNTAIGTNTGRGITTGTGNTIIGALVSGLAAGLTNNIILANGAGTIKAQHDGTDWTLTGTITTVTGSIKTGSPNTPARTWKLGDVSVVNPTVQNRTLEVMVNGTLYYITAKTTND